MWIFPFPLGPLSVSLYISRRMEALDVAWEDKKVDCAKASESLCPSDLMAST